MLRLDLICITFIAVISAAPTHEKRHGSGKHNHVIDGGQTYPPYTVYSNIDQGVRLDDGAAGKAIDYYNIYDENGRLNGGNNYNNEHYYNDPIYEVPLVKPYNGGRQQYGDRHHGNINYGYGNRNHGNGRQHGEHRHHGGHKHHHGGRHGGHKNNNNVLPPTIIVEPPFTFTQTIPIIDPPTTTFPPTIAIDPTYPPTVIVDPIFPGDDIRYIDDGFNGNRYHDHEGCHHGETIYWDNGAESWARKNYNGNGYTAGRENYGGNNSRQYRSGRNQNDNNNNNDYSGSDGNSGHNLD